MASETIDDIVREAQRELDMYNDMHDWKLYLGKLLPRIEAAAKHTCEYAIPNFGCAAENRYLDENARLRAALKPVLDCDMTKFGDSVLYGDVVNVVRDAKRIYESEVK